MKDKHQANEFNDDTDKRSPEAVRRDTMNGKLCEAALCKLLNRAHGLELTPDFRVLGKNKRDVVDVTIGKHSVSVKGTEFGRKLMVHRGQFATYKADNLFPTHYVLCNVKDNGKSGSVTILGAVEANQFYQLDKESTFGPAIVKETQATYGAKGTGLGRSKRPLQADNLILDKDDMSKDLDVIVPVELRKSAN